jgi:DNA topoisomerase-1
MAALTLADTGGSADEKEAKRNIVRAVKRVAEHLGNTPAVCRSCYIHPAVFDYYLQGITLESFRGKKERYIRRLESESEPEERALLKMLRAGNYEATRAALKRAA